MPASFPSAKKTWTSLVDGADYPQAAHLNEARDEITAIEAGYLEGTARLNSSASTLASLSVSGGSTLTSLVVSGAVTIPSTSAIAAHVTNSTNILLGSAIPVTLTFDTQRFVQGMTHSTATNSSIITIDRAGIYLIGGQAYFNSIGTVSLSILSGSSYLATDNRIISAGAAGAITLTTLQSLLSGTTVKLNALSFATTNSIAGGYSYTPEFWVTKVGI